MFGIPGDDKPPDLDLTPPTLFPVLAYGCPQSRSDARTFEYTYCASISVHTNAVTASTVACRVILISDLIRYHTCLGSAFVGYNQRDPPGTLDSPNSGRAYPARWGLANCMSRESGRLDAQNPLTSRLTDGLTEQFEPLAQTMKTTPVVSLMGNPNREC